MRAENPVSLLVDLGNSCAALGKCDLILDTARAVGYDVLAFSPLDVARCPDLSARLPAMKLTGLAARTGATHDSTVKKVGDWRVGIVVAAPLLGSTPTGRKTDRGAELLSGLRRLRPRCDFLVMVSRMGLEADRRFLRGVADPGLVDLVIETQEAASFPDVIEETGVALLLPRRGGEEVGEIGVDMSRDGPSLRLVTHAVTREQPWAKDVYELATAALARTTASKAPPSALPQVEWGYAPASRCAQCHEAQAAAWSGTAHARALQTLEREGRVRPECLRCHSEYYRRNRTYARLPAGEDGVQCASCHGDGVVHTFSPGRLDILRRVPERVCRDCHTAQRSPGFRFAAYVRRLHH